MPITGAIGPCSKRAGRAVVVRPRGRLLRLARSRNWDIVRPETPAVGETSGGSGVESRTRRPSSIERDSVETVEHCSHGLQRAIRCDGS